VPRAVVIGSLLGSIQVDLKTRTSCCIHDGKKRAYTAHIIYVFKETAIFLTLSLQLKPKRHLRKIKVRLCICVCFKRDEVEYVYLVLYGMFVNHDFFPHNLKTAFLTS